MLRKLLAAVLCTLLCTLASIALVASPVSAKPFSFALPLFENVDLTAEQEALIEELRSKYVPQIESTLFPEQREMFEQAIQNGYSLRKAFKAMALTTEQKAELAATLKTVPKGNLFAALTPEQKKEVFLNKKDMFMPTPDEIAERIKAGMESKATFAPDAPGSEMAPTPEEIAEKVKLGFEKKKEFMPSIEEIKEKISAKMEAMAE
ncbi:Spy/CpxP family protein refolding chaperone [Leptolyngbya sp. KIOST-1]|uniref:Spy/CpxP family protein refolding chaperone n=1 Tax=Leptolyngbya sp. KIOST-1 TaxID=1229172 RepID=UPI0012DFEA5C|nr:Spy/CpxP family protein refolding chaperone [Leptolyngbya sp. KIOST-1]